MIMWSTTQEKFPYPNYRELSTHLKECALKYPDIIRLESGIKESTAKIAVAQGQMQKLNAEVAGRLKQQWAGTTSRRE